MSYKKLSVTEKLNLIEGIAVSRGYFGHRYSDDLDFFVNGDIDFQEHIENMNIIAVDMLNERNNSLCL